MNFIKYLRLSEGLTQAQLASLTKTSQSAIAQYEAGSKSPSLKTLTRMAECLGVAINIETVPLLTREDRRSLAYHEAIVEALRENPNWIDRAKKNLKKQMDLHPYAEELHGQWKIWLELPIPQMIGKILSLDSLSREVRQVSPFSGILSAAKRNQVLKKMRKEDEARAV